MKATRASRTCGSDASSPVREVHPWRYPIPDAALSAVWALRLRLFLRSRRLTTARRGALACKSGTAPAAKYATDGLTTEVRHGGWWRRWRRRFSRRWRRWLPRRRARRRFEAAARRFMAAGSEAAAWRSTVAAFAPRPSSRWRFRAARVYGGGYRYGYRHAYYRPYFYHRHHFHRRFYRAGATTAIRITWLSASLLPGDLDLLRAAQDLPYRPWHRHHWRFATTDTAIGETAEMKRRPIGRLFS